MIWSNTRWQRLTSWAVSWSTSLGRAPTFREAWTGEAESIYETFAAGFEDGLRAGEKEAAAMRVQAVQGAIGYAVHRAVPRLPYAMSVERSIGTLRLRLFGPVSAKQQDEIERAVGEVAPMTLHVETSVEPTTFNLEALANDAIRARTGALDVLVDALLELGVLDGEHSRVASGDVEEGRKRLGRIALVWANEVFGPPVETDEELRSRVQAYVAVHGLGGVQLATPDEIDVATDEHLNSVAGLFGLRRTNA